MSATAPPIGGEAIWQQAECGAYAADLPLWERLAAERGCRVLELGAGAGRVALHLAAAGHRVTALEADRELADHLEAESRRGELGLEVLCADAREPLGREGFGLIVAAMQLVHLLGGPGGRARMLAAARAALATGGAIAVVLLDDSGPAGSGTPEPIPDVREVGGWVHSSLPIEVAGGPRGTTIVRLRQLVAPDGGLTEQRVATTLDPVGSGQLLAEAAEHGLRAVERVPIPATSDHVASLALILEAQR